MRNSQKGLGGTVRRLSLLPRRYGLSSAKIRIRLREMIDVLQRLDITPTIPVTAQTLERHPELRSELGIVDPAVHGYRHVAYSSMSPSEQGRDLDAARRVFASHGLPARGFRAPYLAADETTRQLLRRAGFVYDSSVPRFVFKGDGLPARVQQVCATRYGEVLGTRISPRIDKGLVELPVALPDDEILIDGLGITNPQTIARVFDQMLDKASEERFPLVLLVHPERFHFFADSLRHVAKRAVDLGAWRASLYEIANQAVRTGANGSLPWAFAVTGDLDAATLGDFASRLRGHV